MSPLSAAPLSPLPIRAAAAADEAQTAGQLTVDLSAVVDNWRRFKRLMPSGKDVAGVVKANAYGLGALAVSEALAAAGCRTFFVAELAEGIALRPHLPPEAVIYVLSGPLPHQPSQIPLFVRYGVRPILNSLPQVAQWLAEAPAGSAFGIHFDTGMNRLGVGQGDISALLDMLAGQAPALVMSHLACADEPEHPHNQDQLHRFCAVRQQFPQSLASFANSAGMYLGPDWRFDLGRPGLGLYGGNPVPDYNNPMHEVVTLRLKILQVRRVDTAQSVGYGASCVVGKSGPTWLAVVGAGYADGLPRSLSNRGHGVLAGVSVPIVGRVSMDLTTFDVTAVPPEQRVVGNSITLIGEGHSLDALATEAGTISYELLTALGRRYRRSWLPFHGPGISGVPRQG